MYEKVNISITLKKRERLHLYRSKAVSIDMRAYLSETAESLVCKEINRVDIFPAFVFARMRPGPHNTKSE
jgi:hypothetical protein